MTLEDALKIAGNPNNSALPNYEALKILAEANAKLESEVAFFRQQVKNIERGIDEGHSDVAEAVARAYRKHTFVEMLIEKAVGEALANMPTGAWLNYPEHKPSMDGACLCVVQVNSATDCTRSEVLYYEDGKFVDRDGLEWDVIKFAEIRS